MITPSLTDLARLERRLESLTRDGFPKAVRDTLNRAAFQTRKGYQANVKRDLVNRNAFTRQSVRVEQSRTLNVSRMSSSAGSIAGYMERQELGGVKRAKGAANSTPIATGASAGQRGARPRTRLPRRANALRAIQLKQSRVAGSRKLKNWVAVREAGHTGNRIVYLDLGRRKGLFRVIGKGKSARVNMLYDLSNKSVRTTKLPLLKPATDVAQRNMPAEYERSLRFQLRRAP